MRRRVTHRPSKGQGIFIMVWGGVFICIGLFIVIPIVGPFGVLWTLAAAARGRLGADEKAPGAV